MDQRLEKVQECTDGRKARHVCALKLTKRKLDLVVSQDFWYFQVKLLLEALKQLLLNMWGSFQQLLLAFQDADLTHQTFFVFVYELRAHLPQQRLFLVLRFGQWTAIWFHSTLIQICTLRPVRIFATWFWKSNQAKISKCSTSGPSSFCSQEK